MALDDSQLGLILENALDGVIFMDSAGHIRGWNARAEELFGWPRARAIGRNLAETIIPPRLREAHLTAVARHSNSDAVFVNRRMETIALHADGREFPVELTVTSVPHNEQWWFCSFVRDLTAHAQAESSMKKLTGELEASNQRLRQLADHDPQTGALNRRGLERILYRELARSRRSGAPIVVVLVDCDDFKSINDLFGYAAGDVVLQEICTRLQASLRGSDYLCRLGGDEFLLVLPETTASNGQQVAERARMAINQAPLRTGAHQLSVSISAALAQADHDATGLQEILGKLHPLLRMGKNKGKNRLVTIDNIDGAYNDMPTAQIGSVAQSIFRLSPTLEVVAHEMLVRGLGPDSFTPAEIFDACHRTGATTLCDIRCLRACIAGAMTLPKHLVLHFNLFPATLLDVPPQRLLECFGQLSYDRICIELSEQQVFGDPKHLRAPIDSLRASGIRFALDDVGFGRTPIESLLELDPEIIKIDKRLVTGASLDPRRYTTLGRLMKMLETFAAVTVAEGIETAEDLLLVQDLGFDWGQGFYLARPV